MALPQSSMGALCQSKMTSTLYLCSIFLKYSYQFHIILVLVPSTPSFLTVFPRISLNISLPPNFHPHPLLELFILSGTYKENTQHSEKHFCSQNFIWNSRSLYHFLAGAISSYVLRTLEKGIKLWYTEN